MQDKESRRKIRISVRNLVEFIFRRGDIDNRIGKGMQKEAMQEGSRMHRKIQKRMGSFYISEVSLVHEIDFGNYLISVEGRADGILMPEQEEEQVIVDEIKCMYSDVLRFASPDPIHRAQAMCYAYMYACRHSVTEIGIQMTYCNLDTEEIRYFNESLSIEYLEKWFSDLICAYSKWTDFQFEWDLIRTASIQQLGFPFPYRDGQKKLVSDVYRTMIRKKTLFIQAPTGTGKTMSAVFPAVKALGEGLADKIFYLTAKTVTGTVAKDAFDILKMNGLRAKLIQLTAKEKLCPLAEMDCNPVSCPYAKGHYDRVNDAVYSLLERCDDFSREVILGQAEAHCVCPFEMALDLSVWSDSIICDYNYVFDPNVYLKRFFAEGNKGDYLFLVDEAHNLADRGREMYSAVLVKEELLKIRKILNQEKKLKAAFDKCNTQLLEWKRGCEGYMVHESIGAFAFSLMRLASLLDIFLQGRGEFTGRKEISEFYLNLRHFLNMMERLDENYVVYSDFDGDGNFCYHLYCVNPAVNLQECIDKGRSAVFFSATLLPIRYFRQLLSAREDDYAVYAKSIFNPENRLLVVANDVSSLYTRRNMAEYQKIASYIFEMAKVRPGNYMAFFPSYKYMQDVWQVFLALNLGQMDCLIQKAGMNEGEREDFITEFQAGRERPLVGFCVLGGIFSEGIDLKEDSLVGAAVVGTGLPQICNEREILKQYYQEENGNGFDYAYVYPGMNKVLQAAGRVIRTVEDRGVIALLDERFLRRSYQELFPREWDSYQVHSLESFPDALHRFWDAALQKKPEIEKKMQKK